MYLFCRLTTPTIFQMKKLIAFFLLAVAIGCNNKSDVDQNSAPRADTLAFTGKVGAGPHKGLVLGASNGYYIEMTLDVNSVAFYPLDSNGNTVDIDGWQGSIHLEQGGKTSNLPLVNQDGKLTTRHLEAGVPFKADVTLSKGEVQTSATFVYPRT